MSLRHVKPLKYRYLGGFFLPKLLQNQLHIRIFRCKIKRDMKVKFTEPVLNRVAFGTIVEMFNAEMFVVQGDKGGRYILNPNSDYNFGFIPNEEADRKYAERLNVIAEEAERFNY